jgi:hypothetical protein
LGSDVERPLSGLPPLSASSVNNVQRIEIA